MRCSPAASCATPAQAVTVWSICVAIWFTSEVIVLAFAVGSFAEPAPVNPPNLSEDTYSQYR